MKKYIVFSLIVGSLYACVPMKKYQELETREKNCADELAKLKQSKIDLETQNIDLNGKVDQQKKELLALKNDTAAIGHNFRVMQMQYDKMVLQNEILEKAFDKTKNLSAKETAELQAELEAKNLELQRREDELHILETELNQKLKLLAEREARVNELEEAIKRKDDAITLLKGKVANALKSFNNQGLTVVQKNGKIYVSMEAKLLFASGSTQVSAEGKNAITQLAKVLENEKDLEIIVEGHTDTDKMANTAHPKNNWELSVLRATSVVDIMLVNSKMNPKNIMASGRSEHQPIDPADKAKNRRIEVIISPNLNELFDILGN